MNTSLRPVLPGFQHVLGLVFFHVFGLFAFKRASRPASMHSKRMTQSISLSKIQANRFYAMASPKAMETSRFYPACFLMAIILMVAIGKQ